MRKAKALAMVLAVLSLVAGPLLAKVVIVQGLGFFSSVDANGNLDPSLHPGGLSGTVLLNTTNGLETYHLSGQVTNLSNLPQFYVDNPNTFFAPLPSYEIVILSLYKVAADGNASLIALLHVQPPP